MTLQREVYEELRDRIRDGRLPAGSRLPSSRAHAEESGVSRTTVLLAYEQLLAEGYVVTRRGSGTYVARGIDPSRPRRRDAADAPVRLSRYGRTISRAGFMGYFDASTQAPPSYPFDFRYGVAEAEGFPHPTWRRLLARAARSLADDGFDYTHALGLPELRAAIAAYLGRARGVECSAQQVIVLNGSQQGIDLCSRALLDPGDLVLLEEPHYHGARDAFLAAGARIATAPTDEHGIDVAVLGRRRLGIRMIYVTPSHQFPGGSILSLSRRLSLLAAAQRERAVLLEDDYDGEYRYGGRPVEPLQSIDTAGRVVYMGTFSKVLLPTLRLGYLVAPPRLARPLAAAKALADAGTSMLEQRALAAFIDEGHFERHLRRGRRRNAHRRAALESAIERHLGRQFVIQGARAGLHVYVSAPGFSRARIDALVARAEQRGIALQSAAAYYLRPPRDPGLLFGFASLTEAEIERGIRRLAPLVRSRRLD